ncbi:MAG: tetratricopeptide repeat protein [Synergistaceae bacterium]|nr:tetratricopeptide repeat protein [Synergistaceae bacterium]
MRKDLESWLRGGTEQEAVTVTEAVIDVIELQLPITLSPAEPENPPEAENAADEVLNDALNETGGEQMNTEFQPEPAQEAEVAEAETKETESVTEKIFVSAAAAAENLPEDDLGDEGHKKRPALELLEETGSRIAMRMRHIKNTKRASNVHEQSGFRKNRARFFTMCVVAVMLVGTFTALYRNMQRNSYGAMMERARALYAQEQYSAALEVYDTVSREYPGRIEPLLGTAHSAERIGRVDEAITAYRSSLELLPPSAAYSMSGVLYEIGRLYVTLKAWDKAQESFEAAIAADSVNYGAYFSLGNSLEEQDQPDKALLAYRQALELSPSSDAANEAVRRVSLVLSSREELEKNALREQKYEQAIQSGGVALQGERYREASQYFADALAIRSDDANAWVGFGEARFKLGDVGGAVSSMERALERDPEHERAKSRLNEINRSNTRPRQSSPASSPRSSTRNNAPKAQATLTREALFGAGVELYHKGEYDKAFDSFIACLRSPERSFLPSAPLAGAPGPVWRGFQVRLNVPNDARLLSEAVRLNPMDRDLYVNLSMAGTKMGLDRETMRSALNEAHSHALLRAGSR